MFCYKKKEFSEWTKRILLLFILLSILVFVWKVYHMAREIEESSPPSSVSAPSAESLPELLPTPSPEPAPLSLTEDPRWAHPSLPEEAERLPPPPPYEAMIDEPWIHVVKGHFQMYFYRGDTVEKVYQIAIGANGGQKQRVGDNRTPVGNFSVQQIQDSRAWTYDFGDGKGPIRGAYGPWFIRLRTPGWRGIGIHGTHDPDSIGTMITQGCVRLRNEDVEELREKVFIGMKVIISE